MASNPLTPANRSAWLTQLRAGMRPGAAAEALGLDRKAVLDLLDEDEDLAREVSEAEREATEHVEAALYQAAISGNVTACRMWLDLRRPRSRELVPLDNSEPAFDDELAALNRLAAGGDEN